MSSSKIHNTDIINKRYDLDGDVSWNNVGITEVNMTDIILPTEVSLSNAYPNPFNPTTMMTYDVPSDMNVSIGVYDVRGRLVHELVNDMREQGRYDVIWNAENQSSGVYFMKLVAGNTMKTQKMVLIK